MFSYDKSIPQLLIIAKYSQNMPQSIKEQWKDRIDHIYGDLSGQRALDLEPIRIKFNQEISAFDIITSLETWYFLITNYIALSSIWRFKSKNGSDNKDSLTIIHQLFTGEAFERYGIYGCRNAIDFSWIDDLCITDSDILMEKLKYFLRCWDGNTFYQSNIDPFQKIHHELFPKNLLHITGQFYTPEWLAELLLKDIELKSNQTVIDPFCGSGVFLCQSIRMRLKYSEDIQKIISNTFGIDLNPFAAATTRSNLIYLISRSAHNYTKINLNIISSDSIMPSTISKINSDSLFSDNNFYVVDGKQYDLPDFNDNTIFNIKSTLEHFGLDLSSWIACNTNSDSRTFFSLTRKTAEFLIPFIIQKADIVATNPPWVGWEYIPRKYRESISNAWLKYDLFKAKGLDAAFLKEDISNLSLISSLDLYLKENGLGVYVIRPATMLANHTAKGVRRLSVFDKSIPFNIKKIRTFSNINVFPEALTETATWQIEKNKSPVFPIKVVDWQKKVKRWNPTSHESLLNVEESIIEVLKIADRTEPHDIESRWFIADANNSDTFKAIQGKNDLIPRMGIFTGGANAVFYINILKENARDCFCSNITERAKNDAPSKEMLIENELISSVVRGRDIEMWNFNQSVSIICPHDITTKMYPIEENKLQILYPKAFSYFIEMKDILTNRNGFAGWEKNILQKYFYTLQRVGEYSFAPYKVCWKYIASEFTICVVGLDKHNKPILPNDKVMFIPFDSENEAYFVAGVLSSTVVRGYVNSLISKRQISTNVIQSLNIPKYDSENITHRDIATACLGGHLAVRKADAKKLIAMKDIIDSLIVNLYQI
jgi:hypothetical protein